jgi:AraC-like DNA-binding protein
MKLINEIKAWQSDGLFFEKYTFCGVKSQPLEAHSHPEYQIGLAVNTLGKYIFRRESRYTPPKKLSVIHSGETHRPNGVFPDNKTFGYLMLYVSPDEMLAAAQECGSRDSNELPFFKEFTFHNPYLLRRYVHLHRLSAEPNERLAADVAKTTFLALLIKNFSQTKQSNARLTTHRKAVTAAREYLDAHFANQISLEELARVAGVSKYYLCRKFGEAVGVPPHVYQYQLRLNKAKKLLVEKRDISEIALELGFYDQSHFGKYFKKFAGASPRAYAVN